MIIKVCGIQTENNLLEMSTLNIDMVGFNFYPDSPRFVSSYLPHTPSTIQRTGIFVQATTDFILEKTRQYQLHYAQLHGGESPEQAQEIQKLIPVIKVFGIDGNFNGTCLSDYSFCDYFLFDTATPLKGGSGIKFDWSVLENMDIQVPFLISGGIGPEDVSMVLDMRHPKFVGIDLNSKFEIRPGLKDIALIRSFVNKIKGWV